MNDKEFEKQKERLQYFIDKWLKPMGLEFFKLDLLFERERSPENDQWAARTISSWEYIHGSVTWFMPVLALMDDEDLEGTVVHEFTHLLVSPLIVVANMGDLPLQHEFATELIARAFQWVRLAGEENAKI